MIQTTSPPAASRKWLRINHGGILPPPPCCCMPPCLSQMTSIVKPNNAVITHVIKAAHSIRRPPWAGACQRENYASPPPAVGDRRPPVAAERLRPQAHPRRRLAPLVLGAVDHRDGAFDEI